MVQCSWNESLKSNNILSTEKRHFMQVCYSNTDALPAPYPDLLVVADECNFAVVRSTALGPVCTVEVLGIQDIQKLGMENHHLEHRHLVLVRPKSAGPVDQDTVLADTVPWLHIGTEAYDSPDSARDIVDTQLADAVEQLHVELLGY